MEEQKPTIGRIVHYKISEQDVEKINRRYHDAKKNIDKIREDKTGFQAHSGNDVLAEQILPMIIVSVHNDTNVNGKVILDGNDSFWVTSAPLGEGKGEWQWPLKV
ncbi:hypothetical protein LCGC14_2663420 [marine sediment metagenome]|uniref:Uncharacterized protein n=1 Tax=marine sediment metagenome TaxID=412755 RepID=A0A0F8ZR88_9ZZZZ